MIAYRNQVDAVEHLALVKGDLSGSEPVLVRMHAIDTINDMLGTRCPAACTAPSRW